MNKGSKNSEKMENPLNLPLVSIIILNYNGGEMFLNCLRSVLKTEYPSYEVVVVDNGSTDGSIDVAEQMFSRVRCIKNNRNLGFCVGNNMGIKETRGEYIVLLNNDTVVSQNWLIKLMEEVIKIGTGFFNPKILLMDNPKIIDSVGNNLQLAGFGLPRGLGEIDKGQYNRVEEVAYANGTCLLVARNVIEKIGMLDPVFFAYNEDVDWCWRGRMFGIKSYYVSSAVVYHKWGASWGRVNKKKFYFLERNRIITILKNYSKRSLILLIPILLLVEISILFYAFKCGWLAEKMNAYSDSIKLMNYIKKQRNFLQQNRKISDKEVIEIFRDRIDHLFVSNSATEILNHMLEFFARIMRPWIR
jgi:GT2 family glycosyltransferase